MKDIKYYRFGSKNSLDKDYLVDHPKATGTENDIELIKELKLVNPDMEVWDINIIKISNEKVLFSIPSKGNIDAVHNSLLKTYSLHEQCFDCPISLPVERDVLATINKCVDYILTFHKKTDTQFYKSITRKALKTNILKEKIKVLKEINFNKQKLHEDENQKLNSLKKISFYISQTILLISKNIEIYTKDELLVQYPELQNIILRNPESSYDILNSQLKLLAESIEMYMIANNLDF